MRLYIHVYMCTYVCVFRTVPPSKPVILDGTTRDISRLEEPYNEGSDVNLICEVRGGKPPPKLTWYLDNTVIDESYHYNADSGLTVNRLSYPKVGRQHLKARLICEASNTNLVPPQTRLVVLDVNRKLQNLIRDHITRSRIFTYIRIFTSIIEKIALKQKIVFFTKYLVKNITLWMFYIFLQIINFL